MPLLMVDAEGISLEQRDTSASDRKRTYPPPTLSTVLNGCAHAPDFNDP